jgi:hypothetical protein
MHVTGWIPLVGSDVPAGRCVQDSLQREPLASSDTLPPLPIDFGSKERGIGSSIHCADNAMTDDAMDAVATPLAIVMFRDTDTGALNLSLSSSPPAAAPQLEVAQLFRLIMDTIEPIKTELKRIGDKVDGRPTPLAHPTGTKPVPAKARNPPPPSVLTPSPPQYSPTQRVDDEEQEVNAILSEDPEFPSLGMPVVTVSPSPQPQDDTDEKLHALWKYARDFRRRHTKDAQDFGWDSDDEDYGLAIGHLVVT